MSPLISNLVSERLLTRRPDSGWLLQGHPEIELPQSLCELSKSSEASPGFLGTLPQLEHHVEHAVTGETSLGSRCSMPNRPKG